MLRCVLLICILSNRISHSSKYSTENDSKDDQIIYSREQSDERDYSDEDVYTRKQNNVYIPKKQTNTNVDDNERSLEKFVNGVKKEHARVWDYLLETLQTDEEDMLRHGAPVPRNHNSNNQRKSIVNWFNNLFTKINSTTTTTSNPISMVERADNNLEPILTKLLNALDKFNTNVANLGRNKTYYVMEVPVDNKKRPEHVNNIFKHANKPILRNGDAVQKVIIDDTENTDKSKTVECALGILYNSDKDDDGPVINIKGKRREKRNVNETEAIAQHSTENTNEENTTNHVENLNDQNITDNTSITNKTTADSNITHVNTVNARRSFKPNTIRSKLMIYLNDIFQDVQDKLTPVVTLKKRFSNQIAFKIGYITANLNNIESNMVRLKADIDKRGASWDEYEILDVFDVLKTYQSIVRKLVESVKFYLRNNKPA